MAEWIAVLAIIAFGALVVPWMVSAIGRDRRGSGSGGVDSALMELDRILNPANAHAIEARREPIADEAGDDEPLGPST